MAQCNNDLDIFSCTLETCCWAQAYLNYPPAISSTAAYLAIFAVFFILQFGLGLWYRTWGFWIGMTCGLILEVFGYGGRFALRTNPFDLNFFLLYFIPLGLGPAFMTASIYLTLARLVKVYGEKFSYFKPRTYTIVFVSIDVTSLIIQAVGGSLSASAETDQSRQKGVDTLIAGLTFQAASLAGFIAMSSWFANNVRKGSIEDRNPDFADLRSTRRFRLFIWAIALAALAIFIRCVYRVVELAQGFSGPIANNEGLFLALEGPMIMLAALLMTAWHPGVVFRGDWEKADWNFRRGGDVQHEKVAELSS